MARIRNVPPPQLEGLGQPARMHFEDLDRIIIDDVDWRWIEDNDDGHIFQAAHDAKIRKAFSHAEMRIEANRPDFRHDRGWYSKGATKARLRSTIEKLNDLSYEDRQLVLWKEAFVLEFLRLERTNPETFTRGDESLRKAIVRIDRTLRQRVSASADNGRRRRGGRMKTFYDPPGIKSLLGWTNLLVDADFDPLVFCNRYHKCGYFGERLKPEQCALLGKYTLLYATPTKPSVRQLHEDMETEIGFLNKKRKAAKLPPIGVPSYDRLLRQVNLMDEFEKMAGREGIEKALKYFRPVGDGLWDVLRPLQQIEIDHWNVGLHTLLLWSGAWDKLPKAMQRKVRKVRMVLGIAMCRRTHCIPAMILSRTASVESSIRLVEMAVTEKKKFADGVAALTPYDIAGTPDWIFMDGGPAFNNGEFRAVMKDLEVELELPPGGLPHLRGMVERMFRNVDQKLIARFEGRTFPNVVDKGDYDSVGRAGLTIDELGCALIRYVVDCHHNTPQAALGGETPRSCYMRLTKEHGVTPCPDDHRRRNVFGIDIERTLSAAGIRFLGIQYRSKQLQAHFMKVKNARLNCRVYAGNLGAISVKIGKSFLTVKAPPEFHKVDAETWVGAEKILQRRGAHMKKITRPIVLAAIEDFNRLAETGRRRADISDVPMSRNALLNAERSIKIFAKFPDELDDAADDGGDLYGGAIAVGAPKPRRTSAKAPKRRPRAAPTRVKTAKKPRRSSTPLRVPGRQTSKRKWKVKG